MPEIFEPPLDKGIAPYVTALRDRGVETFESCDGGHGHAYPEPAIRFHGNRDEGLRALAVAMTMNHPVHELRRIWRMEDDELHGPWWELTYRLEPRHA